ncbi:hypothetical protein [uncultured Reyranella sp.]|uniref:hypothetical protein n=1 Tax=uncultured Reyranella sp. TaxID=735512 RepID=UPI00259C8E6C|nr:hypothetical protein [uncultured Reyranella sp.]
MADDVKIIRIVVDASAAVGGSREATRALESIEAQTRKTSDVLQKMESGFDVAALATKAFVAAKVVKEVADKLSGLFKDARDAASAVSDFAEQLGLSTTYVQAAMYSAAQHTVSIEKLTQGYTKATQIIGQAAGGQKDAVELFDRLGVKILSSAGKLRDSEAILSDSAAAILKIEDPARRVTAMMELFGKAGAQLIPMLDDIAGGSAAMASKAAAAGAVIEDKVIKQLADLKSHAEESALKWNALVANIGAPIATQAMEVVNRLLGDILANLDRLKLSKQEASVGIPQARSDVQNLQEQLDAQQGLLRINPNNFSAKASVAALSKRLEAAKGAEKAAQDQLATQLLVSGSFPPTEPITPDGTSNPPPKATGGGESPADKFRQLEQQLMNTARAQREMTEAALSGDRAFEESKAKVEAQNKVLDIFKTQLADTDPRLARVRDLLLDISRGKAAEAFAQTTTELQKQNELLEVENRYLNAAPELRARELAAIKARQEAEKAGAAVTDGMVESRRQAIEQNERLKIQADEIKRSNELWTAPLKSALENIQRSTADWIDTLLDGLLQSKVVVEDFGKAGIAIARRMVSEFLSLAIIRPMLGSVIGGLSQIGVVSPATASSLGYGQMSAGGAGGVGGGLPISGAGGSGLGGLFSWWNRPISGQLPSNVYGPPAPGQTQSTGFLGDLTWGQGIGAAAGIGMGAYQLATANGSTGKTIGGIGQMVGAAVSLIPGIGQIAGPLISLASALAPSLFGEPERRTHNSTNASLRYGAGGYGTSGGAWGPGANVSQSQAELGQVGSNIGAVYDLFGGVKDASKVWGMDLSSWTASGNNWSYTSRATHLVDPNGNRSAWRMNEDNMVDTASAQVAMRSILGGAVGTITENMRTAVTAMLPATTTLQDVARGVSFVTDTYEKLGKTVISIEPDFDALEKTFKDMAATATSLGLSLAPVEAEQKKKTARLAQDYIDDLVDPIALALRQFADERDTILANVAYIKEHTDVVVDMARVNEALLRKEAALKEQLYGGAISQLQDAINRLMPGGNLANLDPSGTLAGMKATYQATYAQAAAGDAAAIGRFGSESAAYAEYAKGYYAGSPEYNAIKLQIIEALQTVQSVVQGPVVASDTGATAAAMNANSAQLQQLMATVQNLVAELQAERAETAKLRAVLSRYVTTQAA